MTFYIMAIAVTAFDFLENFANEEWRVILSLTFFLGSLFLIFPYLLFLTKEYSISENLNNLSRKILKKVEKFSKLPIKKNGEEEFVTEKNFETSLDKKVHEFRQGLINDINDLKEYILIYGNDDKKIFYYGINTIVKLIKKLYQYNNLVLDDLLIQIIEIISEIGEKIENDASIILVNQRLQQVIDEIFKDNKSEFRVNLFVLRIVLAMEQVSAQIAMERSRETIRKTASLISQIALVGLRSKPPRNLEYHLIAENLKRICLYSLEKCYDNCVNDIIEYLFYISKLSIRALSVDALPVFKICDVIGEVGIKSSIKKNEVFCIQSVNVIAEIIGDLKRQPVEIDVTYCLACLLELIAHLSNNFNELEVWLCDRLKNLLNITRIELTPELIENIIKILASKSLLSQSIFSDFLDILDDCGIIRLECDEEPE